MVNNELLKENSDLGTVGSQHFAHGDDTLASKSHKTLLVNFGMTGAGGVSGNTYPGQLAGMLE
ncbi:MAG: hypothetical protein GX946_03840 [Oligosphaeraceae bacterium]|nr:hypothetical protein [Oligosphaeraceae bacterium]